MEATDHETGQVGCHGDGPLDAMDALTGALGLALDLRPPSTDIRIRGLKIRCCPRPFRPAFRTNFGKAAQEPAESLASPGGEERHFHDPWVIKGLVSILPPCGTAYCTSLTYQCNEGAISTEASFGLCDSRMASESTVSGYGIGWDVWTRCAYGSSAVGFEFPTAIGR